MIVGETENYGYEHIVKAINFVNRGVAADSDLVDPAEGWSDPPPAAVCGGSHQPAPARLPICVGQPNPLMMRTHCGCMRDHRQRIGPDMVGVNPGMDTALVLSILARREDLEQFLPPRLVLSAWATPTVTPYAQQKPRIVFMRGFLLFTPEGLALFSHFAGSSVSSVAGDPWWNPPAGLSVLSSRAPSGILGDGVGGSNSGTTAVLGG